MINPSISAIAEHLQVSNASSAYINRIGYIPQLVNEYPLALPDVDVVRLISHAKGIELDDAAFIVQYQRGYFPIYAREEIDVET